MIASADEPDDRIRELLELAERLGYLTYETLNERLPDGAITPEKLDDFLAQASRRGIRLVDEADVTGE